MSYHPISYWFILSYTLYGPPGPSFFQGCPHLSKCKLRMTFTDSACQRCFLFLYLFVCTYWTRNLLRFLFIPPHLISWSFNSLLSYSNSFLRLCSPMRTDIILGRHSNYQPIFSHPSYWNRLSSMNLGWICS